MENMQEASKEIKIAGGPNRYIQGPEVMKKTGDYIESLQLGDTLLLIVDKVAFPVIENDLLGSLQNHHLQWTVEIFGGECCQKEIDRLFEIAVRRDVNLLIGVGGGKALDTAKAVAHKNGVPVALLPTIASTDAPCSSLSVLYTEDGVFEKVIFHSGSPDLVLVDSKVISQAPVRFLVAGMGDALATGCEAEACYRARGENSFGTPPFAGIKFLAKFCTETILEYGLKAKIAVERGLLTEDVERIIEANIFLSGIGFESGGCAAAHAIADGLTVHEGTHSAYHGEKVAFGVLTQFVLESRSLSMVKKILDFCRQVGLPINLAQLGIPEYRDDDMLKIAEKACTPGEPIFNMPLNVTVEKVKDAIIMADCLGNSFLNGQV
jgi:glycerol dehydrogenase